MRKYLKAKKKEINGGVLIKGILVVELEKNCIVSGKFKLNNPHKLLQE